MKRKNILLVAISLLLVVLMVGCNSEEVVKDEEVKEEASLVIEHTLGKAELEEKPERVVVLDYGTLDALETLGLKDVVVGLPKGSLPDHLSTYEDEKYIDIGTLKEPNFEVIYELEPDLIIIGDRQASMYDEFEELSPTIYVSTREGGDYLELFESNMMDLGKIFDEEDKVEIEVEEVKEKIKEARELVEEKGGNGLFLMANDGELSVYGRGSRFNILYEEFGVTPVDESIESSTHGQKITYEYLVEKDPDYLFVMDRGDIVGGDTTAKNVMENDLVRSTKAYKEDNIIYLNSPIWYVGSGGIQATKLMAEDIIKGLN